MAGQIRIIFPVFEIAAMAAAQIIDDPDRESAIQQ
jgi:hypothetical protein